MTLQTPARWTYTIDSAGESAASYPGTVLDGSSPLSFGAKGDGIADDSVAIQAALNAASTAGGGRVDIGSLRYAVANSISVPPDVMLRGDFTMGAMPGLSYYPLPSQLILGSGATINMASRSTIMGLVVSRGGLPMPAVDHPSAMALIAAFNGTGITAAGSDILIRDVFVIGHQLGVSSSWDNPTNQQGGRATIDRVWGDCTNGIQVSNSYDITRVTNCHFWPFLTVSVPGGDVNSNSRAGIAYDVESSDWTHFIDCFGYAYGTNFHVFNGSNTNFIACDSDGGGPPNTYGWDIEGDTTRPSDPIALIGCTANSAPTTLYINPAQPSQPTLVRTIGCRWAAQVQCVHVMQGSYVSENDTFESGSGIYAENGTVGAIIGSVFRHIGNYGYQFANAATQAAWEIIVPRFTGGTNLPTVVNQTTRPLTLPWLPGATSYANDAAAAAGGVPVGQLYRNGSAIMVRVA